MNRLLQNRLITWLLCLVLAFKMLVPAGFMPDLGALQHGVYKITICSGDGTRSILVNQDNKKIDDSQQDNSGHKTEKSGSLFCPFAGMHASGLPILAVLLSLLLLWRQARYVPERKASRSVRLTSAWARAPPAVLA